MTPILAIYVCATNAFYFQIAASLCNVANQRSPSHRFWFGQKSKFRFLHSKPVCQLYHHLCPFRALDFRLLFSASLEATKQQSCSPNNYLLCIVWYCIIHIKLTCQNKPSCQQQTFFLINKHIFKVKVQNENFGEIFPDLFL